MSDYYKLKEDVIDLQSSIQLVKQKSLKLFSTVIAPCDTAKSYDYTVSATTESTVEIIASSDGGYTVKIDNLLQVIQCRFAVFKLQKGNHSLTIGITGREFAALKIYGCGLKVLDLQDGSSNAS